MLIVISPAKSLDYESPLATKTFSQPEFLEHSQLLIDDLQKLNPPALESLMKISPALANLNMQRFIDWHADFTPDNARQALLARSEEHTSELQSRPHLVCRLLLEKKKNNK